MTAQREENEMSSYNVAKSHKQSLETLVDAASKKLQTYPCGSNGITPDEVKFSLEYTTDKTAYDTSFQNLRTFNAYFSKVFKSEYAQERREKRIAGVR